MKKSDYGILFLVALVFFCLLATLQKVPGYMDAEYYFGQSIRIFQRHDLVEPFIWNYLNNPASLSVPGFGFWLPVTSFAATGGLLISGTANFFAAKILFIIMASGIVIMTAFLANGMLPGRRSGWLAGLLALLSGFYLPFITITDTFTPFMFFGGLFFVFMRLAEERSTKQIKFNYWFIFVGLAVGIMNLTRSDGILWLAGGWIGAVLIHGIQRKNWKGSIENIGYVFIGFMVVMIPWYVRNYSIYHAIYPAGNGLMLWLIKYDDLFVYPSRVITFSRWISSGFSNILLDRLNAFVTNLGTLAAAGGAIILVPIMFFGGWIRRKSTLTRLTLIMLLAILGMMTIVFPYAGERGGFFHSLSAVQVGLWSLVPVGLDCIIQWGVKHRSWKTDRSWKMFGSALVLAVGLFSAYILYQKLNQGAENGIAWNRSQDSFRSIEQTILGKTGDQSGVIMLNDPPGYSLLSGRPSVMIPSGNLETLVEVGRRYGVQYLALNGERSDIQAQFDESSSVEEHFKFLFDTAGNSIYEFKP